jgi:hypothetical protein
MRTRIAENTIMISLKLEAFMSTHNGQLDIGAIFIARGGIVAG